MTKSHAEELSRVYDSLFEDFSYAYPTLRDEFVKDRARLARVAESRGVYVYYVDLPALGKHFDRCLATGAFSQSGLVLSKRAAAWAVTPKFLRGLHQRVFDDSGAMKEHYDVQALCCIRQAYYLAKKAKARCSDHAVRREVGQFVATDSQLPRPESFWDAEVLTEADAVTTFRGFAANEGGYRQKLTAHRTGAGRQPDGEQGKGWSHEAISRLSDLLVKLDAVSGLIASFLGPYEPEEWMHRHGPGAISDPVRRANKYAFTNWSHRLDREFPYSDCAFHSYVSWADRIANEDRVGCDDPSSKLIAVPKTYLKPRLIAAEPSEHQWCQQKLRHYFYARSQSSFISSFVQFHDQTLNQRLCRKASTDGSLATVDLSAASDRVTCTLVGQLFRSNPRLLLALQASRTRRVRIAMDLLREKDNPVDFDVAVALDGYRNVEADPGSDSLLVPLKKFSTMGSACTFPVESLAFLAITLASVLTTRRKRVCLRNVLSLIGEVAVFGDDIIVPEDSRELLFDALKLLDFEVNLDKSYWTGRFRESCGLDAYDGVDVTPAYWRAPNEGDPESISSTVEVSNNFYERFLVRTAKCIARTVPSEVPMVSMQSGVCGQTSFVTPSPGPSLKRRWNKGLQREEVRHMGFATQIANTPLTDETALLQFFTEQPSPQTMWVGGVKSAPQHRKVMRWTATTDLYTDHCGE